MSRPRSQPSPSSKGEDDLGSLQLLDACQEGVCPVCFRQEQAAHKALTALLHEQVTDPLTRRRLTQSHGFCPRHAWLLPGLPNSGLAVALIYHQVLLLTLEQIDRAGPVLQQRSTRLLKRRSRSDHSLPKWRRRKAPCHLCTSATALSVSDLRAILDCFGEPGFQEAFGRSAGLCLPHLVEAADLGADHENLPGLLAWHAQRWRGLHAELGEFARKSDYRYAQEPMGRERDSWLRVLQLFAGRPGIFGPDRPPGSSGQ